MARVSTKEAAELISLVTATPADERVHRWPSLLTLLTRWTTQAAGAAPYIIPARPWERKQQQQQQQQAQGVSRPAQQQQQQQLLQQAASVVQLELQDRAQQACPEPSGAAAAALGQLFVPAVLFLSAALAASPGQLQQQLQPLIVAATCEAAAALAAAPAPLLLSTAGQQAGLPAVLSSCKALLLVCKDSAEHAAWLLSCLLSALHTAVPNITQHTLHQQQQPHLGKQMSPAAAATAAAADGGTPTGASSQTLWLQQQLQGGVACAVTGLLSGLYNLGRDFGISCCRTPAAAAQHTQPHADATTSSRSRGGSGWAGLDAVTSVLQAACTAGEDDLLLGLAAAVAAGLSGGILEGLPPAAAPTSTAQVGAHSMQLDFAAVADGAWQGVQQQQRQQQDPRVGPGSSRQQLMQHAEVLLQAVQAACCCSISSRHQTPSTHPMLTADAAAVAAAAAASAAVGQGLLGQAYGRLWSTCGHLLVKQQQQQQGPSLQGMLCTLQYLTDSCCSMAGVFYHAVGCHNDAAANAWLAQQQQQHSAQEVGMLARWLAVAAAHQAVSGQELRKLLSALRDSGVQLARSYSTFQMATPAEVAAGVDAAALRQQLDRNFAMHVAVLSEGWQACKAQPEQQQLPGLSGGSSKGPAAAAAAAAANSSIVAAAAAGPGTAGEGPVGTGADPQAAVVAVGLSDLAALQFCRVQLPAYVELLRGMVTTLATSSSAADAFIATALPSYEQLIQAHPAAAVAAAGVRAGSSSSSSSSCAGGALAEVGGTGDIVPAAVWLQDTVTAAELTFLLPLLPVAIRAASNAAAVADRVLPLLLLLLPHLLVAVAQAAHGSFAGLVAVAADQQKQQQPQNAHPEAATAADEKHEPDQQQQQLMDVVQQAVPMYLQRSLSALPDAGSLEGLSASYYSLLKNLPNGSAMGLLAVAKVADRVLELVTKGAEESAAAGGPVEAGAGVAGNSAGQNHQQQQAAALAVMAPASSLLATCDGQSSDANSAAAAAAAAANKLFELLVVSVQLGDYQLLPAVLEKVGRCVLAAPLPLQQVWLSQLYAGCLAVEDYTRKPALMVWVDGLQKQLVQQARKKVSLSADRSVRPAPAAAT